MQKKIANNTKEFELFRDYWDYHQKCYNPITDEEWEELVAQSDKLIYRYKNSELELYVKDLVNAHIAEAERKYKDVNKR